VALLAAAYAAYGAVFLFLTLAVSAVAATPRAALILLVGLWAGSVFLVPRAAAELSRIAHPTMPLGQFETALAQTRREGLGGPRPRARLAAYRDGLLKQYGVQTVAELPIYWVSTSMQKMEEIDHEFFDFYYQGLNRAYLEQRRFQDAFGLAAPVLPLASLSMGMAGTDLLHQQRFAGAAEAHRRLMVLKMNNYLSEMAVDYNKNQKLDNNISMETNDRVLIAPEAVFRLVPPFAYTPPTLDEVMGEYRGAFAVLGGWLLASLALALVAVRAMSPQARP
jgi:ABC-2 type transport system permease protein